MGSLGGIHYGSKYVTVANNVDAPEDIPYNFLFILFFFVIVSLALLGSVTSDIIISGSSDEGIPGIRRINTTQYSQWVYFFFVITNNNLTLKFQGYSSWSI